MRKIALAFVTLVLPFSFAACGASEGTVYDKQYKAAYDEPYQENDYMQQCTYNPTTHFNDCHRVWIGSHTEYRHHNECYMLKFKNSDGKKGDDCVGSDKYNSTNLGDYYSE